MKKFELNLDAAVVILVVFLISFGFNFYQRYQYSDLLKEHISLQYASFGLENEAGNARVLVGECLKELDAATSVAEQPVSH